MGDGIQEKMCPRSEKNGEDDEKRRTNRSSAWRKECAFQAGRQHCDHRQTEGVKASQHQQAHWQTEGETSREKGVGKVTVPKTVTDIGAETADDEGGKVEAPRAKAPQRQDRRGMCQWERHCAFEDANETAG